MRLHRLGPASMIFVVTAAIFLLSPVRVPTDSRYSPLVCEALLHHRSFALDRFFPAGTALPYQVETIRGHVYSWYPPGSPVLATPLVGALSWAGLSVVGPDGLYDEDNDVAVQALVAVLLMALLAALIYETARAVLPPWPSAIVALGAALGSQIWSTASRALWGDTFLALILGAVIWLMVGLESAAQPSSPARARVRAALMATLLAWGYFCRPTASIAVVAVTAYLALNHRRLLIPFLATGAGWLVAFLAWSWLTFGTLLPTYYRMGGIGLHTFGSGLLGILLSPSRGQLLFVPATLFVVYLVLRYARSLPLPRLVLPAAIGALGHLALIAAFGLWHGGHSYGPRYLTPLVPWLALLAALGLRALRDRRTRAMRVELGVGALLLAASVLVNARGACARETWKWNAIPDNVSLHPERVWSWRDPQFLAGLVRPPMPALVPAYLPGTTLDFAATDTERYLITGGWSGGEGNRRWTDGRVAEMAFGLEQGAPPTLPLMLEMEVDGFLPGRRLNEQQRIEIALNGAAIATVRLDRPDGSNRVEVPLPAAHLARANRLTFRLPDAAFAAPLGLGKDSRQLGVAVHWMRMRATN